MTGLLPLDWAILTVSLFNTILLLWLGLTVLLTAERRSLGVWILCAGLLLGAGFFISHTAILGGGLTLFSSSLNFWWRLGWLPVITVPLAWYGMILWFVGYWSPAAGVLRHRHRMWLGFLSVFMVVLLIVLYMGHGLPTFLDIAQLNLSGVLTLGGLPMLLVLYPVYMVACIGLAVAALRHPAQSERFMGDIARRRTYPWLLAASLMLLAVSLLVGWFMLWTVGRTRAPGYDGPSSTLIASAAWFDMGIQILVALAVIFIGQAIVSYEIFTGKSLPRREFFRHWRDALFLAGGYATVVGGSLTFNLNPIYSLLLTTFLMVAFYALFSWRSFVHRDQFMDQLRPFVGSQNLVEQITSEEAQSTASTILHALCDDVLEATRAELLPGPLLADLVGKPLVYPQGAFVPLAPPDSDLAALPRAGITALPVPADGLQWAVGLWSARGLSGALLLGHKRDGGVYTQEEIEVAQATSERILDMLAGEETARRLMALQRKRLAETQILDHQTRRALHDDVLPALHTTILDAVASQESAQTVATLTALHRRISDLIHTHPGVNLGGGSTELIAALKTMLQTEFPHTFTSVTWGGSVKLAGLDALVQEVLFYAVREVVRNAALHSRGDDPHREINLKISVTVGKDVTIQVIDDGVGIPGDLDLANQGGLALHSIMLTLLGGKLTWEPADPTGTRVEISLPNQRVD